MTQRMQGVAMAPAAFIDYCRRQLRLTYQNALKGASDPQQKYRTEGMFHAIKQLGLMEPEAIKELFEQEHQLVFGQSSAERLSRQAALANLKATAPDAYFAIPAISRKS